MTPDLIEKLKRGCEWQFVGDGSDAREPNTDATNETMMAAALAMEAAQGELKTVEGALERTLKREATLRDVLTRFAAFPFSHQGPAEGPLAVMLGQAKAALET